MSLPRIEPRPAWQMWTALLCALAATALYAVWMAWRSAGVPQWAQIYYVLPIVAPFALFLYERWAYRRADTIAPKIIDAIVITVAMWRVFGHVPFVSGHVLFLSYAVLTARQRLTCGAAALILAQTCYLKFIVWHDWQTPTGGLLLALLAAYANALTRQTHLNQA